MTDYFNDFPSIISNKSLPSPADTPYETSSFIRSKRSSRATTESFHEDGSAANNSLAPSAAEHQDNGRYSGVDPRRFTPTLHASLVSEILNLRRELDSKNNLVENLESSLSGAKSENETLNAQLSQSAREVRKAKQQVHQMEKGTYEALEDLVKERDAARATADELRGKLESVQKKTRHQDEDAVRSQTIWEGEKQRWDNERRQLERRIHVTESRLRTFVDQMAVQQQASIEARTTTTATAAAAAAAAAAPNAAPVLVDFADDGTFKDSGLGNESDTASITSSTPMRHRRNKSSLSTHMANLRSSTASRATVTSPDLYAKPMGNSLADELGIDEEDESDMDEFDNADDEMECPQAVRRAESRQSERNGEVGSKAKRVLGLTTDLPASPTVRDAPRKSVLGSPTLSEAQQSLGSPVFKTKQPLRSAAYVDNGYQPSPPPSPVLPARQDATTARDVEDLALQDNTTGDSAPAQELSSASPGRLPKSPISPPQTPVIADEAWSASEAPPALPPIYVSASTQTEEITKPAPTPAVAPSRDSLSPPLFVPSIAIHPPSSRPSTPRASVLPPGTRNASTQADLPWPSKDAGVQTEEIRIDRRMVKLPAHLLPSHLLPSPTLPERRRSRGLLGPALTEIVTKLPLSDEPRSPPPGQQQQEQQQQQPQPQSPPQSSPEKSGRTGVSSKDARSMPLKAIPLPRPVLSPVSPQEKTVGNGPLNRASQYGVVQPRRDISYLADPHESSDESDFDDPVLGADPRLLNTVFSTSSRPPQGRFGLSEPPKAVPEHKEISPDRRPRTADSYVGAPAPSVASARNSSRAHNYSRPSPNPRPARELRSRSPSFGSLASSNNSTNLLSQYPPYPIPTRSSSRAMSKTHSEGSRSPTHDHHGHRSGRSGKAHLRKVQSANAMRNKSGRTSPTKHVRRRRRSPDLTPVVSMAFDDSPAPTKFPIPDLPMPTHDAVAVHSVQNSVDMKASTVSSVPPPPSEEASLVDAIAATMVGEWMWKYIRKRKSFGIGEDTTKYPVDSNGMVDVTNHGNRHKRWVWLSPYERTVMWDTKQPTTGSALLGKKGRKLAIQSVLEVKDLTPLPKDAELSSAFNRSILILTPARALKFTAITQERHNLWMTALSFLAQSGQLPTQLTPVPYATHIPVPSVPSVDSVPVKRHRSPSFGRGTVRDSIRLAKGKRPDHLAQAPSSEANANNNDASADAPSVPRLYISTTRHNRKRSNTSPRVTPALGNLRSFSSSVVPTSSAASSAHHHHSHLGEQHSSLTASATSSSHHNHRSMQIPSASLGSNTSPTSPTLPAPNFFEAVSTMRMEAFVDPNIRDGVLYVPAPPPGTALAGPTVRTYHQHSHHGHLRGDSSLSQSTLDRRRAGYVFDEDGLDPFKGF